MSLECAYCERDLRGGHAPDCDRPRLKGSKASRKPVNPTPLEKDIERKIGEYAKKKGLDYEKFVSPANRGQSDRILLGHGGLVAFLELKRKGEKPTPLQYNRLRRKKELGMHVGWVDNITDGCRFINFVTDNRGRQIVMGEGLV